MIEEHGILHVHPHRPQNLSHLIFTKVPEVLLGVKALRTGPSLLSAKDKVFF